jgi:dethiobiotin synthetase
LKEKTLEPINSKRPESTKLSGKYLYIMGSGSGAGKSTVCMGILAQLVTVGYAPSELAYIKPMTQCTDQQAVTQFCERMNISHRGIGELVYRKGFTRDFIDGLTKDSTELKEDVLSTIADIGANKKMVLIDGIGDPAAGTVVGLSNADIAVAVSAAVVFVGKPGLGAAIDNTILCVSYMHSRGINNIGLINNKIPLAYLAEAKAYVSKRLSELLPTSTFLGSIAYEDQLEQKLKYESAVIVAEWFGAYIERQAFQNWLAVSMSKCNKAE